MWTTNSHRARPAAARAALAWPALACTALACTVLLSTACSSSTSAAASPGSGAQTAADTFLAGGQAINGSAWHEPACGNPGCPLSGDSTTILYRMNWTTWSATEAVGTGTYQVDACNPSCAAGPVYPVAAVVTFSQPVKVCSASGTRWFWSRASFRYPDGLPKALQGRDAPQNPWTFTTLVAAARHSCG
jgi:hypothetical protein